MALYQLMAGGSILRTTDNAAIPPDPANLDYVHYQTWLLTNTPDPVPVIPLPTAISVTTFWSRFTPAEQAAIQTAAATSPALAHAMTFAMLGGGTVNLLAGPIATTWMNALVTAGVITPARRTAILTP